MLDNITYVRGAENETATEKDCGPGHCERHEEPAGIVHEGAQHRAHRQTKVEGSITPRLQYKDI